MIYTDPVNEKMPEGEAMLLFNIYEKPLGEVRGGSAEMWKVKFLETGIIANRIILIK